MFSKRNASRPSDELLDKVRYVISYRMMLSSCTRSSDGETDGLASYFGDQLMSLLGQLGIQAIYRKSRGILDKRSKLSCRVKEDEAVCLEFVDIAYGYASGSYALHAVHRYNPGRWEQKIDAAYHKCRELAGEWDNARHLEQQLGAAQDAQAVVALMEATQDPQHSLKLLALSPKYDANSFTLYMAYLLTGKAAQAHRVLQSTAEFHPADARLHLSLGNFYWAALCNVTKQTATIDLGPLRQVTLQALNCDRATARQRAENHFLNAVRLSKDRGVEQQAKEQLVSLRAID